MSVVRTWVALGLLIYVCHLHLSIYIASDLHKNLRRSAGDDADEFTGQVRDILLSACFKYKWAVLTGLTNILRSAMAISPSLVQTPG